MIRRSGSFSIAIDDGMRSTRPESEEGPERGVYGLPSMHGPLLALRYLLHDLEWEKGKREEKRKRKR